MDEVGRRKNKKIKILISCWWEVITRKLQMDSFHKAPHCLFGLKRTVIRYNEKLSWTAKYWILCVWYCLTVKHNKCQTKIAGLDTVAPHTLLFQHFLKWHNHFPSLTYCITMGFTLLNEEFAARCVHWVSKARAIERNMKVSGKWIKIHAKLSYYLMKFLVCAYLQILQESGRKEERTRLNEACHCVWPVGSLLVLLFALLICMLMYLFYGSTVLIHFKINYPSGTPIPRLGSNVY